jgi:hypothetical protein
MAYVFAVGAVLALALGGLGASNLMHDSGAMRPFGRRVASAFGGLAYLVAVLWLDMRSAMAVLVALTLLVVVLGLSARRWIRGTQGKRRSQQWSQITFAVAGTTSIFVGWWLLNDKWIGFLPVAFLAWGDNVAGLIRDVRGRSLPWPLPSAAMLAVGLVAACMVRPYWIGVAGSVAATIGERYRPAIPGWDDNLNLVAASLLVMSALYCMSR